VQPYDNWGKIAAYFDGDGNLSFSDTSNQPYKLSLAIVFTDQSYEQIQMIKEFLNRNGVITSNILRTSVGTAWMVVVSRHDHVLRTMKELLPHLFKKAIEIGAAIDYYEGRITGNQLQAVFCREVEAGRRERHPRKVRIDVPFTYPEGDSMMRARRKENIRATIARTRPKVTRKDYEEIRRKHFELGFTLIALTGLYPQYARETIRRILGRGRGYVMIKEADVPLEVLQIQRPATPSIASIQARRSDC
jgi:hypothetical protein